MPRQKKNSRAQNSRTRSRLTLKKKSFLFRPIFNFARHHVYLSALLTLLLALLVINLAYFITFKTFPILPDTRALRIDTYFTTQNMPLAGHGKTFVAVADSCGMDWRLLPAIAVRESSGGKRMMNHNPFGWGGAQIPFDSIEHAITEVGRNLCGDNPRTSRWYATSSTQKKLYYYNGTVIPSYPDEVHWIMKQF